MQKRSFLSDWRVHVLCLILVAVSELIGIKKVELGPISFSLLPMLYALVLGIFLTKLLEPGFITAQDMDDAGVYIGISVMYLIAFMSSSIGPNLSKIVQSGPALILQEFGNLFTVFFALTVGVLLFKMDRTIIGSAFSISREPSLAVIGTLYGLDSPEGRGVMGSYIAGTILGTIFCGILAGLMANIAWFSPESLAMAAGTGSSSMMSASIAPIVERFPEKAEELNAYAAASQVLTSADGVYMSLLLAIPMSEWLYKKLKGKEYYEKEKAEVDAKRPAGVVHSTANTISNEEIIKKTGENTVVEDKEETASSNPWPLKIKILILSGLFAMVGIYISTKNSENPLNLAATFPGMLWLFFIIVGGNLIEELVSKLGVKLPTVIYIALLSSFFSVPGFLPGNASFLESMKSISLLPLCTPILAYAGISTAKDLEAFKKQGFAIICVTLLSFVGTYIGSAVIANVILKAMGTV